MVARRGDGETEGAERGTCDEPWSRARSAPGLARARALRRRHSALLVTRERARFLSGEKEEGRRSVGGFRMTRFAGSPTREKGRGRTLVFGDAVMFLETPPMVAFDALSPSRRLLLDGDATFRKRTRALRLSPAGSRSGKTNPPRDAGRSSSPESEKMTCLRTRATPSSSWRTFASRPSSALTPLRAAGRPPSAFTHFFAQARFFQSASTFPKSKKRFVCVFSFKKKHGIFLEDIFWVGCADARPRGRSDSFGPSGSSSNRSSRRPSRLIPKRLEGAGVRRGGRAASDPSPRWRRLVETRAPLPLRKLV